MKPDCSADTDRLKDAIRQQPYQEPPCGLLERLLDIPEQDGTRQTRPAQRTRWLLARQWMATHAMVTALFVLTLCGACAVVGVRRWMTIREAQREFNINDKTMQTAIASYKADNNGRPPEWFHQLTTPVAYLTGSWSPDWGKERICSEEEIKEWESRPRWEREPYINNIADYHLWESLTPKEQDEWVQWYVEWNSRPQLINERFSPEQKARFLALRETTAQTFKEVTLALVAKHAPKTQIESAQLDAWGKNYFNPINKIFQEMRLERPLHSTIRPAVQEYREKYHRDPKTLGDLKEFHIEGLTPGLLVWQRDRPLKPEELQPLVKWEKLPWDSGDVPREKILSNDAPLSFSMGKYDWHTWKIFLKEYGPAEVYDGYVQWWVNRYFESYLPYYPFTDAQHRQISDLRDKTFQELTETLQKLVARQASRKSFEDETAAVWDKAATKFNVILSEAKKNAWNLINFNIISTDKRGKL